MGAFDVTIAIPTFGESSWVSLAHQRAIPSAKAQGVPVIHRHGTNLAEARNEALAMVETEFVTFLDADDELGEGYVEAMARGTADLRAPAVSYVKRNRARPPGVPRVAGHEHDCGPECLREGNFIVIGAAVRTRLLRDAGGWRDFPWSEDWSTWIRCWKAGASIEVIREAVYRAYVNPQSRNRGAPREVRLKAHADIHRAEFPELYE